MSKEKEKGQPSVEECGIYLLMDEISDASCKDVITFIISKNLHLQHIIIDLVRTNHKILLA